MTKAKRIAILGPKTHTFFIIIYYSVRAKYKAEFALSNFVLRPNFSNFASPDTHTYHEQHFHT